MRRGPLFVIENHAIFIGVTRWALAYTDPEFPTVYARVSAGLDFILEYSSASVVNDNASVPMVKGEYW